MEGIYVVGMNGSGHDRPAIRVVSNAAVPHNIDQTAIVDNIQKAEWRRS